MSQENTILLVAHWNGEIQTLNSEVQYSELPKKSLLFNSDISYNTFLGQITSDVLEDGFQGVESVYGKFPRHQSGVYVGLRPLPINDEPIWRHFIRKASREYDVVEVFIGVSKNVEEEADGNPFFHQQMDQPSSSHFAQHIDSDPDDAEYIAPSTEDEESSEEEEDISADEGEDGQDVRAMPQLHDRQSHVLNLSLRPMFHIPIIEVDNREVKSLEDFVSTMCEAISISSFQHHVQHGIYSVVVDGSFNNGHRETFVVNLNGRTCTCGDWSYINAYSDMLMPLPDEADWPTSGYEIVRPTARARTQTGRPTRTRCPNNMDYRPRRRRNEQ
ncbi:hypothetical protein DM860_000468 [Cuscuta australis]|uniref:Uncharacterized protein n=1 Tax=Cuscuta australis TaxID=267555 RepID=A0A328CX03_9ASTE|nr:hypothetical protein DM860_000468 [Cuscuta australis]